MNLRLKTLITVFMCTFAWSGAAFSAGCGKLKLSIGSVTINWTESFQTLPNTFYVNRTSGSSNCSYFVTFSKGGATSYTGRRMIQGTSTLPYQLYSASNLSTTNILEELPDANQPGNVISGSFANGSGSQLQNTYYFDIPYSTATSPTLVKSGSYTDSYVVKLYQGTLQNPSGSPDDTTTVTATAIVPKILRISLVSSGGSFDQSSTTQNLNFGTLSTGASKSLDLKEVTNAGYSVTFSSQNNGALKHATPGISTVVPYTLSVNSIPINLSSSASAPVEVARGSGQTSLNGNTQRVSVTIGQISNQLAGNYSDIITVTATTTE